MGRKEEQRAKCSPVKMMGFFDMVRSAWYAQKGINAEVKVEVKCGGWLAKDVSPPVYIKGK